MGLLNNLVAYYKLDESSGNAADSVGNKTLTNNNTVTYNTGKINNCSIFDGTNQFFKSDSVSLFTNSWTISCWIKPDDENISNQTFLSYRPSTGAVNLIQIEGATDRKVRMLVYGSNGSSVKDYKTSLTLTQNSWNFLSLTWDGTDLVININGTTDTSVTKTTDNSVTQTLTDRIIRLGSETDSSNFFDGSLDGVGIWDRALTASEVFQLYNHGSGVQYPFSGLPVDYYDTGNDGTDYGIHSTYFVSQSFTASRNYDLESIKLMLYRTGTPTDNLTIELFATSGELPTGSALSSGSINVATISATSSGTWYEATMSSYSLVSGTKYALRIKASSNTSLNRFNWCSDGSSASYSGGALSYSENSGSSWTTPTTEDTMFEIYGALVGINFDSEAHAGDSTGTSLTHAHTCSGDNRILFVATLYDDFQSASTTGVTYNGVALTKYDTMGGTGGPTYGSAVDMWYLIDPDIGTYNIVASFSNGNGRPIRSFSTSYNGVSQTDFPDSGTKSYNDSTNYSISTTTVANNCWLVFAGIISYWSSDGDNTTTRYRESTAWGGLLADSAGKKNPAGSYSISFNSSISSYNAGIVVSIAPFSDLVLNLKSVNGLDAGEVAFWNETSGEDVKSINGLLIAE
jgi:hypothetical protein